MYFRSGDLKIAIALSTAALFLLKYVRKWHLCQKIARKIKLKQQQRKTAFQTVRRQLENAQLSDEEIRNILDLDFTDLQRRLQNGTLKATDVLHAYQFGAFEANKRLNAVTEPLLDAEAIAETLDLQTTEKQPLHGIPVSLKESFDIAGLDTTLGLGQFLNQPKSEDAVIVQVLKQLGAVPFVRTNVPQTLISYDCKNPIYGQTRNPHDESMVPGGSSGGESALIGSSSSIIGFGSDIGGSLRVPSHFCGCYCLRPTAGRVSNKGFMSLTKGQTHGSVGPMTRDFDSLLITTKAILTDLHFQLDPSVPPLKFRNELYNSKQPLTIGFYVHDGYIQAVPACQRAVMMAKEALESMGHKVVEFTPPRVAYALPYLLLGSTLGDGGLSLTSKTGKDMEEPSIQKFLLPSKIPKWLLWILSWVQQIVTKDPVLGQSLRARMGIRSVYEWFQQTIKVQEYKDEFLAAWRAKQLDAVICPPFAMTAVPIGKTADVTLCGGYCWLYSLVNYPTGVIPVTKVTFDDVINLKCYPSNTAMEKDVKKYSYGSEGLPVGVQCAGLPYQEEIVLRVMKDIETGLRSRKD